MIPIVSGLSCALERHERVDTGGMGMTSRLGHLSFAPSMKRRNLGDGSVLLASFMMETDQ